MANDTVPDNQRDWPEGSTPTLSCTLLDINGAAIPLANMLTLTLTQWIDSGNRYVGKTINSRNKQSCLNANNVTFASTSGLLTWQLTTSDTAMISTDQSVVEEKHWFRFDFTYNASGTTIAMSGPGVNGEDYYTVHRKKVISP